jgi:hypothetical protein
MADQLKLNSAPCVEIGDTVTYEIKGQPGELRKIQLTHNKFIIDFYYTGQYLLGHLKGDNLEVPDLQGWKTITILSITKGESAA